MPQGRRKVPYSGKAKKMQLQKKRDTKASMALDGESSNAVNDSGQTKIMKINAQPFGSSKNKGTRFALKFFRESDEITRAKKEEAYMTLETVQKHLEINADEYYSLDLDFPKRPQWSHETSREELNRKEQKYFTEYISKVEECAGAVSFFELNLETWRQFWRVLEMSDIILIIVDIRFPSLMFPMSLYNYVTNTLNKSMVMVLNKIDLVPPSVVVSWKAYFNEKFPSLHILLFTSLPEYNLRSAVKDSGLLECRRRGKMKMVAEGAQMLLAICAEIVDSKVDLTSWQKKITEEMNENFGERCIENEYVQEEKTSYEEYQTFHEGILTIGCIGYPNAGKSSLLNALMGKKVVSVSKTPGHTKHFQTIFLTPTVKLCDCPGLVFPSLIPRDLQILMGSFPIAQLREPYSSIKFLAEHVDLIKLLSLEHHMEGEAWSAYDICNAWATKKGFFTARACRPDMYRAANHILRMELEGKLRFFSHPPGYFQNKEVWENHEDIKTVMRIRGDHDAEFTVVPEPSDDSEEDCTTFDPTITDSDNTSSNSEDSDDHVHLQRQNKFSILCD